MSEAERLQKIIQAQEKELKRLRKLLERARIAKAEYSVEDKTLHVTVTCIGVDEYHFIEKVKPELSAIANAILGAKAEIGAPTDSVTGAPLEGGVAPQ